MKRPIFLFVTLFLFSLTGNAQVKTWTFKECLDRAVEQNITLQQEMLNNEIDEINLKQARYNRTPSLNFNGNQGFNTGRSVDPTSYQFVNQNIRTNNFALSGSVTLFNGFQNVNTIKQNKLYYESGALDIVQVKNNVILNLASAYLSVLLAYEQADIAKGQVAATEAQVSRTRELVDAGRVPELDLFKIQAQLEADHVTLINAENQIVLTKLTLAQIMNLPGGELFEVEKVAIEALPPYWEMTSDEIYNSAANINPGVRSASVITQSSIVGLRISKGTLLPRLTLGGSIGTGYSSARTLNSSQITYTTQQIGYLQNNPTEVVVGTFPSSTTIREDYPFSRQLNDNLNRSFTFSLIVPIFNQRQGRSAIDRSKIAIKSAELNEQNMKNLLRKDIEQSYAEMKAAVKRYEAAQRQVEALEKSYGGTEYKYNLGLTTPIELIIEKNNYVRGQSQLLQAKYEYLFNVKVIDLYVGKAVTF